jgi:hypothetical protein
MTLKTKPGITSISSTEIQSEAGRLMLAIAMGMGFLLSGVYLVGYFAVASKDNESSHAYFFKIIAISAVSCVSLLGIKRLSSPHKKN